MADRTAELPREVAPVDLVRAVGCVKVAQHTGDDPTVELAERAAREACFAAGMDPAGLRTFVGTSKGAVAALADAARQHAEGRLGGEHSKKACLAVALGPQGYLSHRLRERVGVGSAGHHVAACASSLTALHQAQRWLERGGTQARTALVVTAEAALLPLFIHSYERLGVIAEPTVDGYRQRPLDGRRQGFMLGEFGAAVVLRRLEPEQEPQIGQIELVETALASECNDLIRPSPDMGGLRWIVDRLLERAPEGIDLLHPHAPGTVEHDATELEVLRQAIQARGVERMPDLYACKGAVGHGLGAAGLVSLIVACLCMTTGKRPPMPWLNDPLPWDGPADLAAGHPCSRMGTQAVFSAGFGSHVAGALLRRY